MTQLLELDDDEAEAKDVCIQCDNVVPERMLRDGVCSVCRREEDEDDDGEPEELDFG